MTPTALLAAPAPATLSDALRVAGSPGFDRWQDQIRRTGGCADPIHLTGTTTTRDRATGDILHRYSTDHEPGGRLRIACGNRRASRCPACAWTYAGDTYHLIRAGLTGDTAKGTPTTVRDHPRVFTTLTAPGFGPVHNRPDHRPCRCGTHHTEDDPALGTALDPAHYDYEGAVLWNNHAGDLWRRFTIYLFRETAKHAGITQRELRERVRISYAKVAEYQKRGAIHFHAVVRFDGPDGPDSPPPPWATHDLLTNAIRTAADRARITVPAATKHDRPERLVRWGAQLDIRPIHAFGDGQDLTEQAVAAYVAKYATKAAETTGTLDRPVGNHEAAALLDVPEHTRRLISTCLDLHPAYPDRNLRAWAHMLGFRGHFSTKSRRYSTTLGALRQARADYRALQDPAAPDHTDPTTLTLAHWTYAGHGHTPGESWLAATIHRDLQAGREAARHARTELADPDGWGDPA
ncbi:replication initiator protein RepSA [Streptomyces yaizuensis]|uniref:Replication initiation protein n=1 Tax=Streptomyces yaizuensis TaxID=2989713 RepID=A0ABQ5P3D2_9ACTN|nr:replication initiator protein RepSA [Streptomyces sp. YSPA8]GLF96741.1 replication initiation protein [Streptomyces sp. YSPA8]